MTCLVMRFRRIKKGAVLTKIRCGMPKYSRAWGGLLVLGGVLMRVSKTMGMLVVAAGMSAFVAGMITERREWEAKHKAVQNP